MSDTIQVLDKGYVTLVDHMGSDLSVVNAARVSFGRSKDTLEARDVELMDYLASHDHTSPFRHATVQLHIKAPIFVFRQLMKHQVGCSWNELSGRYTEFKEDDFYMPVEFRKQATVNKQGSEGTLDIINSARAYVLYNGISATAVSMYKDLLALGVAREQARGVLPVGIYSQAILTASLQAIVHLIRLRTEAHAQAETQEYGKAIKTLVENYYPNALTALLENS